MNAKVQKQAKRIAAPDLGAWAASTAERLTTARTDLRRDPGPKKKAADLTCELLSAIKRRVPDMRQQDVMVGSLAAAFLAALAVGLDRSEFVAWLRRYANHVEKMD